MANALTLGLIAAALSLAASAALAAPAAYYPSLGYGQDPPPRQARLEPTAVRFGSAGQGARR